MSAENGHLLSLLQPPSGGDPQRLRSSLLLSRSRASEVRDALSRLPNKQREVLRLAYFGACTQSQIAAQLGIPLGTVKARTFRGLRRLGQLLASDHQ